MIYITGADTLVKVPVEDRPEKAYQILEQFIVTNKDVIKRRIHKCSIKCEQCQQPLSLSAYSRSLGYYV